MCDCGVMRQPVQASRGGPVCESGGVGRQWAGGAGHPGHSRQAQQEVVGLAKAVWGNGHGSQAEHPWDRRTREDEAQGRAQGSVCRLSCCLHELHAGPGHATTLPFTRLAAMACRHACSL